MKKNISINSSTLLFATELRLNVLEMVYQNKSSHIGSVYSCADILAVLYNEFINFNSKNRARLILSKGHAGAGVYSCLFQKKIISKKILLTHCKNNSTLSGHISNSVKGVDFSTGSLGQGIGVACGMALSLKKDKKKNKVYSILSDGELNEGSTWEAFLFASHFKLNNLTFIIDKNNLQSITSTKKTLNLEPLIKKLKSFNLYVKNINGHSIKEIRDSLKEENQKVKLIIANTTKGKGVSFMENKIAWHYKHPDEQQYKKAKYELSSNSQFF